MSKQANTTLIGAFVIGALTIVILALVLLGGGALLRDRQSYITYFDGSIQGLREGANVTFRGVRIGQVRKVYVRFDESSLTFDLPVIIEIDPKAFRTLSGEPFTNAGSRSFIKKYIERGLRAKLQMESFVTGKLQIDLDFYPGTQVVFRDKGDELQEIPTIPSDIQLVVSNIQSFLGKIKDLPVEDLLNHMLSAAQGADRLVHSPELLNSLKGIDQLINRPETQQLTVKLQQLLEDLDSAVMDANQFMRTFDQTIAPVAEQITRSLHEMETFTVEAQKTLAEVQSAISDGAVRHEVSRALSEFSAASRSFRILVEYLEQHPEALIKGKPAPQ